jgi:single-stranded-DNA-specific exonuclease
VAHAALVVDLLTCRDLDKARALAAELDGLNTERRTIQKKLADEALERLVRVEDPFVVVSGPEDEGWHRGVVGIVASRLKDELHRPVAVVSIQGQVAVGSVRSTPGVHAVKALDAASDLLVKYGGHPAAAGFTVPTELLPELQRRLNKFVADTVPDMNLSPDREVDAEVPANHLVESLQQELSQLGPFGMGNPEPRLVIPGVRPQQVEVLGKTRAVLKFRIPRDGRGPVEAIWFGRADMLDRLQGTVDVLGNLSEHRWNGSRRLQIQVSDVRPANP